jgi:PBP1b-binding outer membrane lipoprotein LpoB
MRARSEIIALTLSALLVGGCATRPDVMRGRDDPYENTDRPIVPSEKTNRPIIALDFGVDEYAAVRLLRG